MASGRVLILEDDETLRAILLEALADEGFVPTPVDSFDELLAAVQSEQGDLVVADFWGRGYTDLEASERDQLRTLNDLAPVILVTGRTWAMEATAQDLGVSALLRKPFDLTALLTAVEATLAAKLAEG